MLTAWAASPLKIDPLRLEVVEAIRAPARCVGCVEADNLQYCCAQRDYLTSCADAVHVRGEGMPVGDEKRL